MKILCKLKIINANLCVRKITLNNAVVSAIEKTLSSPACILTLQHSRKRFWLQRVYTIGNKKIYFRENQSADWLSA